MEGTYHRGSKLLKFGHSHLISPGARGGYKIYVTKIYVTILKNPFKRKSYKARMLFFSVEGTYHRGSIPFVFGF